jgi:NAD(P)-dependent dehydrogenase (short-subunit alcohol dehydrogenase family)
MLLENKQIIVVGGAGLLGQAFGKAIAAQGGTLVVADIDAGRTAEAVAAIGAAVPGAQVHGETVDITSKASLQELIGRCSARAGRIDAVVNNAYPRNKQYGRKLEDVEYADFCENVNLHLGGYFLSTQQFAEHFRAIGGGSVINVSSIYGLVAPRFEVYAGTPMTMPVEYAAIKAALQHLSVYFMRYYKGHPIRFNCLLPGGIIDRQPEAFLQAYRQFSQTKGMLAPEDLCGALVFLLSDLSQYVNGQNLVVDDGWSA